MPSVREWLASLGLAEYANRFAEHRIDFSILGDLTDRDLKDDLGIVVLGDRRRLLRAIAEHLRHEIVPPQRDAEQELDPGHDPVAITQAEAGFDQVQLEAANVVGGGGIGRADPQIRPNTLCSLRVSWSSAAGRHSR